MRLIFCFLSAWATFIAVTAQAQPRGNILLLSIEVEFGNADRQRERVHFPLTAGSETRLIHLDGRGRFIRFVKVRYGSLGLMGRPTVVVPGRQVGRHRQWQSAAFRDLGPRWKRLSTERVEHGHDVIQLSRRDGRFDAILFRVRRSPARIRRVRVIFGNGQQQDFILPKVLYPGEESGPGVLGLRTLHGRYIDRIVLVYDNSNGGRRALVEVWARQVQERRGFLNLVPRGAASRNRTRLPPSSAHHPVSAT